ncbi:MAG TPA: hemerythrin domain-containing protein [Acidimicrobiales bacterium]|nr:hemerythrin domain-containing protein [Acidimicrobiales bacterium]
MAEDEALIDTSDMYAVHNAFRRALGDAPAQVTAVSDGDGERARRLADYLGDVLWLLHAHHAGEDELLYPLLEERAPEHLELFARMEAQHASVSTSLGSATMAVERFGTSASLADGQAAAAECASLLATVDEHLTEEEKEVLPIAARAISAPEWGALPAHALSHYRGERLWLPFGLVLEEMPDDMRNNVLAKLPPPVLSMWTGGGSDAFAKEMGYIRGGS